MAHAGQKLTFLFTDIEGSTALWETRPAEMSASLQRHDVILRNCIEFAGGTVFKTGGDAFSAVFTSAPAAVGAAAAIQVALAQEAWPGPDLHVRAAIHLGEVEERDNDYFGAPLNRVSRLLSAGHGDQILLSGDTYEVVRSELAAGVDVLPLGSHRLKDLQRPMEIVQLLAPGLRVKFPPLRTLDARRNNLPAQLTRFIGRDREIAEAKSLLNTSRLVTMTGAGGSGKTRLALHVAADMLDDFGDGLWFIDLAPVGDPEGVPSAVATALGLRDDHGQPLLGTLTDFLRARQLLLVLDNCEHLIAACAVLAAGLLGTCPRLRILATSREALAISGETAMRIPSLSLPPGGASESTPESLAEYEAVQLFIDRAMAGAPHFALTNANAPAVAQICARLDGVPLAIELAAARLKSLSVEQIAARLDDRFRLLTGGSRTALPRQQTLRAAIDWSYQLLTAPEQAVLRRLSVFAGGWTLEAAEAVCASMDVDGGEIIDLVARLVDRSLVVFEGEPRPRYRFLETVRQYAAELLSEAGEVDQTRERHLQWCVAFAEVASAELRSADSIAWFGHLQSEDENVRSALEWARGKEDPPLALMRLVAALGWFWSQQGHLREEEEWVTEALRRSEDHHGAHRAGVLEAAAGLANQLGEHRAAWRMFFDCSQWARECGDSRRLVSALGGQGATSWLLGEFDTARVELEGALAANASADPGDPARRWWEVKILNSLANVMEAMGEDSQAESYARRALELARRHALRPACADPLNGLGELARARGDWMEATAYYEEALEIWRETGARGRSSIGLLNLASIARHMGDIKTAARRLRDSLALQREIGSTRLVWASICVLAGVLELAGRNQAGARALGLGQKRQGLVDYADRLEQMNNREALIAALGEEAFEREYAIGQAIAEDEALHFADTIIEALLNDGPREDIP